MALLTTLSSILLVALGLGFVIFIHELGHFLVAKWHDVKVEKFSIGFGPPLWRIQRGETEYILASIPLGGYVKMLGEIPEHETERSTDPRAYHNQSVGARMGIISAGVLMNLISGFIFFVIVYSQGWHESPATIGAVIPGSPAYEAGLRPGDEIIAIDGRRDATFSRLIRTVLISGRGQEVNLEIRRPGLDQPITVPVQPRREEEADMPSIGVAQGHDLRLLPVMPFLPPPGLEGLPQLLGPDRSGFRRGDRVVAVAPAGQTPQDVADAEQFKQKLAEYRNQSLDVVVERPLTPTEPDAATSRPRRGSADSAVPTERLTFRVPPARFVDFGMRLTMGPIASIRADSPAQHAGFRKNDRIVTVDGRDDLDPMRLPDYCYERALAGESITFQVRRGFGDAAQTLELTVKPEPTPPWLESLGIPALQSQPPLDVPGLGLAYPVFPIVQEVEAGSVADRAGIQPEDHIRTVTLISSNLDGTLVESNQLTLDETSSGWVSAFHLIQSQPAAAIRLTINDAKDPLVLLAQPVDDWFHPLRGLVLAPLVREVPPPGPLGAIQRGFRETRDSVINIYAMFRSLAQERVSRRALGGPIKIAGLAYESASLGLISLLHFLGMLSINLAVLNFLPIPPLDGGHMVFLIGEKIRGKPLPEQALIAAQMLGIMLVLGLMVFVIFQDLGLF